MSDPGRVAAIGAAARRPGRRCVLSDLDGTLAPIVARPELAAGSRRGTRRRSREIADRFAVAAVVSGRRATVAREIVGLEKLTYIGNHGFELLLAERAPRRAPRRSSARTAAAAARFAGELDAAELDAAGLRVEDKGPIVALHWRGAADEAGAEALAERIAAEAEAAGLVLHRGRKVLELRPPRRGRQGHRDRVAAARHRRDGRALRRRRPHRPRRLLGARSARRHRGACGHAVRIGVASAEGPAEIARRADLVVDGPAGLAARPRGAGGLMQYKDLLRGTVLPRRHRGDRPRRDLGGDDQRAPATTSSPRSRSAGGWSRLRSVPGSAGPPRTAEVLRGPLAAAKTSTQLPAETPVRIALARLWPIALFAILAGAAGL